MDGTELNAVTDVGANNIFVLTKQTLGAGGNLANNQALTFYFNNSLLQFTLTHATGVSTKVLPITAGNININSTQIGFALPTAPNSNVVVQFDNIRAFLPDGTEVFFKINGILCSLSALTVVGPPGRVDLNNGLAGVATVQITASISICDDLNTNIGLKKEYYEQ